MASAIPAETLGVADWVAIVAVICRVVESSLARVRDGVKSSEGQRAASVMGNAVLGLRCQVLGFRVRQVGADIGPFEAKIQVQVPKPKTEARDLWPRF